MLMPMAHGPRVPAYAKDGRQFGKPMRPSFSVSMAIL